MTAFEKFVEARASGVTNRLEEGAKTNKAVKYLNDAGKWADEAANNDALE